MSLVEIYKLVSDDCMVIIYKDEVEIYNGIMRYVPHSLFDLYIHSIYPLDKNILILKQFTFAFKF